MLYEINQWLEKWRRPVWETIYRGEAEVSRRLIREAYAAWEAWEADQDDRAAAKLYLDFLEHQVEETYCADATAAAVLIHEALRNLARPQITPRAVVMQARVLLVLRCWAHHQGVKDLPVELATELLSQVPEEDLDHQAYSYLAFWAFIVREKPFLERAYRYFLIQPVDFMVDYSRQRVKVMLALVEGPCEAEDLLKLVNLMPHPRHAEWVGRYVKPRCEELGIWSDDLDIRFKGRVASLAIGRPQVPPRDKPEGFHVNF